MVHKRFRFIEDATNSAQFLFIIIRVYLVLKPGAQDRSPTGFRVYAAV